MHAHFSPAVYTAVHHTRSVYDTLYNITLHQNFLVFAVDAASSLYGYNLDVKLNHITLNAAGRNPSDYGLHGWQS